MVLQEHFGFGLNRRLESAETEAQVERQEGRRRNHVVPAGG